MHHSPIRHLTHLDKDVVALAQDFIRYPSITPHDHGCLSHLAALLQDKGWKTHLVPYGQVTNLYARLGNQGPHLCFAGHVDVVPSGPEDQWKHPPFEGVIQDGWLYGRGVADMKGAIACFLSALGPFHLPEKASISLLLTSDEEGEAIDGTKRMVQWMKKKGEKPDVFLIGEPTGNRVGDVIQIGRRGSITGSLVVHGTQGHIAYPENFDNPVTKIVRCAQALMDLPLDSTIDAHFEPSRLEITSIDTGNPTSNIVWGQSSARFGLRFNPQHCADDLVEKIKYVCRCTTGTEPDLRISGAPVFSRNEEWISCVLKALQKVTNADAKETTKGGITDGRFLIDLGPVLEVGLPEDTIHQINERVSISDLYRLKQCYEEILWHFFSQK